MVLADLDGPLPPQVLTTLAQRALAGAKEIIRAAGLGAVSSRRGSGL